ncbi:MAG: hypothetical protein AB8B72_04240 [Crocinitomicaceae bacterium]
MKNKVEQSAEDLKHIRQMMEQSNKFLSLSGLSGIVAGAIALAGVFVARTLLHEFKIKNVEFVLQGTFYKEADLLKYKLIILSAAILILALGLGFIFTYLKTKKSNATLYSKTSLRVASALFLPLAFGGFFTIILAKYDLFQLAAAATLIFYGMSLLNASKYLNIEIKYLAITEMVLGVFAAYFLNEVMLLWAIGFGVMHILYGSIMYFRYDRKK